MTGRQCPEDGSVTIKAPKSLVASAVVAAIGAFTTGGFSIYQAQRSNQPYTVQLPAETQRQLDNALDSIDALEGNFGGLDKSIAVLQHEVGNLSDTVKEFVAEGKENRRATWEAINEIRKGKQQ